MTDRDVTRATLDAWDRAVDAWRRAVQPSGWSDPFAARHANLAAAALEERGLAYPHKVARGGAA